jgi:hypothetical protein
VIDAPDLNACVIGDVLYLNRALITDPHLTAVIAHELAHLGLMAASPSPCAASSSPSGAHPASSPAASPAACSDPRGSRGGASANTAPTPTPRLLVSATNSPTCSNKRNCSTPPPLHARRHPPLQRTAHRTPPHRRHDRRGVTVASLALTEEELRRLAEALAPLLLAALPARDSAPAGWMDARAAAAYAGCSLNALHKAMSARGRVPPGHQGRQGVVPRRVVDQWRGL